MSEFTRIDALTSSNKRTALYALRDTLAEKLADPSTNPGDIPNMTGKFLKVLEAIDKLPEEETTVDPLDAASSSFEDRQ